MAKIQITHTDKANILTPSAGNTNIFYDSDGILKQKDSTGYVSLVGMLVTGATTNIEDLGGTNITSPITGDTLIYDGSFWVNSPAYTGVTQLWEVGAGTGSTQTVGTGCIASGDYSVAEGFNTLAGDICHAEGWGTLANLWGSHAEGKDTQAINYSSHAQNDSTQALGLYSHAAGYFSIASGNTSFVHSNYSTCNHNNSAILGGSGITSLEDNMVYVPGLEIVNSNLIMTDRADGTRYNVYLSGGTFMIESI